MQAGISLFFIDRLRHYNYRRNSCIKYLIEKSDSQQAHESGQVSSFYIYYNVNDFIIHLGSSSEILNIGATISYFADFNWIPWHYCIQHVDCNNINILFHKIVDII